MSGQWEQYVEKAARAVDPFAFEPVAPIWRRHKVMGQMRAALAAVAPLIAEDTRTRMVEAAAAAVNREGEHS